MAHVAMIERSKAMTAPVNRTDIYTDFDGFGKLRSEARQNSPEALRTAARQFESIFTQMMLKSMRDASLGDPMFDSQEGEMYRDMLDKQLSLSMSQGQGLGLAETLIRQLGGAPAASGGTGDAPEAFPLTTPATSHPLQPAVPAAMPLPPVSRSREDFVAALWPHAQRAGAELGVDPRAILAQAALESGWGQSVMRGRDGSSSHNLFGIKADARWRGETVTTRTLEYSGGVAERRTAAFRAYDSYETAFQDYVDFVRGNPRYRAALTSGGDAHGYARAIAAAGYATDPQYAQKISRIVNGETLNRALAGLKA